MESSKQKCQMIVDERVKDRMTVRRRRNDDAKEKFRVQHARHNTLSINAWESVYTIHEETLSKLEKGTKKGSRRIVE